MAIAWLDWSLDIQCPKCGEYTDLADGDDDSVYSSAVFNNNWDAVKGHEVTCRHCEHEFILDEIRY